MYEVSNRPLLFLAENDVLRIQECNTQDLLLTVARKISRMSPQIIILVARKMANHKSADKSARQTTTKTLINKNRMSKIRTFIKKLEAAIVGKDKSLAAELFKATQSLIMKGVTKNLLKKNSASRKISRLSSKVKNIA